MRVVVDAALRAMRGDRMAMVFQDPMTGLNPVLRILRQLTEPVLAHGRFPPAEANGVRYIRIPVRMREGAQP